MDLSMRFRVNRPKVIHETIDDEVVMIDFDTGNYFSLNDTGTHVWRFIEGEATLGQIIDGLGRRYKGSPETMEDAVIRLLDELREEALIVAEPSDKTENASVKENEEGAEPVPEVERPDFKAPILQKFTDMQNLLLLDPIHEIDESGWPHEKTDKDD